MILWWLCIFIGHKYPERPDYHMRETHQGVDRPITVFVCERCPHWKVVGNE